MLNMSAILCGSILWKEEDLRLQYLSRTEILLIRRPLGFPEELLAEHGELCYAESLVTADQNMNKTQPKQPPPPSLSPIFVIQIEAGQTPGRVFEARHCGKHPGALRSQ